MLSKGTSGTLEGFMLSKALLLLDELKTSDADAVVCHHLRSLIEDTQLQLQENETRHVHLLRTFLEAIAKRPDLADPVLERQIRMVALRLTPPLSVRELASLQEYINVIIKRAAKKGANIATVVPVQEPDGLSFVPPPIAPPVIATPEPVVIPEAVKAAEPEVSAPPPSKEGPAESQAQVPVDFAQIRETLARHVEEAIAQNQEFGVLLGIELDALREAERIQDIEKRRVSLINEIHKFSKKHRNLSNKFDNASKYLKLVESSNQQLSDELDRVRLLSLTDELTGLPNRRAFLRRLEDEVGRVKRYGIPVSMTIIDLDGFKAINDHRGHGGGDAVLRGYSDQILSVFRHHDMVARYGGEEFAVILPNTTREGAVRALQKVQKRVSETACTHNGERFPMPTFSAGLAEYLHGETLSDFIERADAALYHAKRLGRNRVEIAQDMHDDSKKSRSDDFNARQA